MEDQVNEKKEGGVIMWSIYNRVVEDLKTNKAPAKIQPDIIKNLEDC